MAHHTLYASSPQWAAAGERLDELLDGPGFRVLKKTTRTLAGTARSEGNEIFVKRIVSRSLATGMVARFCGSPARKSMAGAEILDRAGFLHPRVLAVFEQRQRGAVRASYVVAEYLHRPKILSRFALADGRDFAWRRRFSQRLAHTIRRLHDAGCYTRDLQETNLMVEADGSGVNIYFIDLEDFRRRRRVSRRLRLLNLVHLDRSIGRFVSRAHRLRFLHNYLGERPSRAQARALVAELQEIERRLDGRHRRRRQARAIRLGVARGRTESMRV